MRNFKYCSEDISLIENYEKAKADDFKGWDIHHRLETHNSDGTRRKRDLSMEDLIALDMYLCRPASELIFMRNEEHTRLHNEGKHHSDETRKKISEARKGKKYSKGQKCSDKEKEFYKRLTKIRKSYKKHGFYVTDDPTDKAILDFWMDYQRVENKRRALLGETLKETY